MKRYLLKKEFDAEPMLRDVAEERLGKAIQDKHRTQDGFLILDAETLVLSWLHENDFRGIPFDSYIEKINLFSRDLEVWQRTFRNYTKNNAGLTTEQRQLVYTINRHLNALSKMFKKTLSLNIVQRNKE